MAKKYDPQKNWKPGPCGSQVQRVSTFMGPRFTATVTQYHAYIAWDNGQTEWANRDFASQRAAKRWANARIRKILGVKR